MLALVVMAASSGYLAGRAAKYIDRRRGDILVSEALASGGISLLFVPRHSDDQP